MLEWCADCPDLEFLGVSRFCEFHKTSHFGEARPLLNILLITFFYIDEFYIDLTSVRDIYDL